MFSNVGRELVRKLLKKAKEHNIKLQAKATKSLKRISLKELYLPENKHYVEGFYPFVLTEMFSLSTLDRLQQRVETVLEYFSDKTYLQYYPFGIQHTPDAFGWLSLVSFPIQTLGDMQ